MFLPGKKIHFYVLWGVMVDNRLTHSALLSSPCHQPEKALHHLVCITPTVGIGVDAGDECHDRYKQRVHDDNRCDHG